MYKADIATLFPEICEKYLNCSIMKKAKERKLVDIKTYNIRDYTKNKHKKVDDYPYGGGNGMLMMADPIYECYKTVIRDRNTKIKVIYLSPQGKKLNQKKVEELAKEKQPIMLICGHYEGIDQRVIDLIVDEEISIGDSFIELSSNVAILLFNAATSPPTPFGNAARLEELNVPFAAMFAVALYRPSARVPCP